jgi:hypothetical protein
MPCFGTPHVYDLEIERFLHRHDLDDPPPNQIPLRLLAEPSRFFNRIKDLPDLLHERADALFNRFERYEVAVVTLHATPYSEIGRIFERVNTRGTPLTTVELLHAATWTVDFDLLMEIDAVRWVLTRKHYGQIDRMLLLRAIAAAAGLGFSKENVESLALVDHSVLAAGQQPGHRDQDRPVGPRQPRGLDLTLEHGDLMTQDEDLGVLGTVGTSQQGKPAEHSDHHQVSQSQQHRY